MQKSDTISTLEVEAALQPHRPRLELAAAAETGCPTKGKNLAGLIIRRAAESRGTAGLKTMTARKLLEDLQSTAHRMRAMGALAQG